MPFLWASFPQPLSLVFVHRDASTRPQEYANLIASLRGPVISRCCVYTHAQLQLLEPTYAPSVEYAFKGDWLGTYFSEILLFVGSLSLFSIFILMAIFWADLLKGVRAVVFLIVTCGT